MTTHMPVLHTERLLIRPFQADDLDSIHTILDKEIWPPGLSLDARRAWLQWSALNSDQLGNLFQPPYGDRAVVLRSQERLVGAVGYVPMLGPYEQLPALGDAGPSTFSTTEFGLFWAIAPAYQGHGYATEAARALVDYAFNTLRLKRVVAITADDNLASAAVMRRLGMTVERNPYPEPEHLQVVGVLWHPDLKEDGS